MGIAGSTRAFLGPVGGALVGAAVDPRTASVTDGLDAIGGVGACCAVAAAGGAGVAFWLAGLLDEALSPT